MVSDRLSLISGVKFVITALSEMCFGLHMSVVQCKEYI